MSILASDAITKVSYEVAPWLRPVQDAPGQGQSERYVVDRIVC